MSAYDQTLMPAVRKTVDAAAMDANIRTALRSPRRAVSRGSMRQFVRHQRQGVKAITMTVDRMPARMSAILFLPPAGNNPVLQFARDDAAKPTPVSPSPTSG
jgi:hypothetical protein